MNANQVKKSLLKLAFSGELILRSNESNKDLTKKEFLSDFSIPVHWETYRLGDFTTFIDYRGRTPKKTSSGVRLITAKNIKNGFINLEPAEFISEEDYPKWMTRGYPQKGNIFFTTEAPLGNVAINDLDQPFATAQRLITIQVNTNCHNKFLFYYLMSNQAKTQILKMATGTTVKGIKTKVLKELIVPLPPIEEQKLISEKIDALLAKVKEYHYYYTNLEEEKKIFPKRLEKSILQYAIEGKLVDQDTSDEPASELLKRISEQKEQMIREKVIKKEKSLPPITEAEIPFDIPSTWDWVRLNDISVYIQRGRSPKYSDQKIVPVISQKCVQWSGFSMEQARYIDPATLIKYDPIRYLVNNDLLWNSTGLGTVGRVAIYNSDLNPFSSAIVDSHVTIVRLSKYINHKFIFYYLSSDFIQGKMDKLTSGSTKQKELNTSTIKSLVVPLPPLHEQNKIVEQLDILIPKIKKTSIF